ncbi:hypothetical protein OKW21_004285 [Catalinimonas alkaloidigena]|uniref:hypothetical protein n=1 Tax=Catalinimonas alkaloidigena TaxID=1075417 RepID=UPI002405C7F9|nr:hypothetical protein [Catalinimonas alkaloidigena]MDF9799022.1 hypothetical protein [Catalinimonas alkaloidigena]
MRNAIVKYVEFPGQPELYHFGLTEFKVPVDLKSVSPTDTDWFVIHINLSRVRKIKEVNGNKIALVPTFFMFRLRHKLKKISS